MRQNLKFYMILFLLSSEKLKMMDLKIFVKLFRNKGKNLFKN